MGIAQGYGDGEKLALTPNGDLRKQADGFNPLLVGATSATHFGSDFYASFFSPLLPLLMPKYGLSLGVAGMLATLMSLAGSMTQPIFGYLADRRISGSLLALGVLVSAFFMSTMPITPHIGMLVAFLVLAELGVSAAHPAAASLANKASGRRRGLGMSLYMTGGSLGFSLGPLAVVQVANRFGLEGVPYLGLFGLALAIVLALATRRIPAAMNAGKGVRLREALSGQTAPMLLILAVIMLRAIVSTSLGTYLPLHLTQQGTSLVLAGASISIFRLAGTGGGMVGGPISDRVGRHPTLFGSSLGAIPFLWLSLVVPGRAGIVLLVVASAILNLANPAQVLIAQELAPQSIGTVSGLTIGFAWGLAGFSTTLVGFLGEAIGLGPALIAVVVASLLVATLLVPVLGQSSPKRG